MVQDYVTDADLAVGSAEIVTKRIWPLQSSAGLFVLENGNTLPQVEVAYETWGTLSPGCDNVILIEHGLTGSSHAAGRYAPSNRSVGYWDGLIGPGKVLDTDRFFVVAVNSLGGCRGSTGPASLDPRTGKPYSLTFPLITIRDMVHVQEQFLRECFGITDLLLIVGGSMGGMQALEWAINYGDRVRAIVPIACAASMSARGIAFNELARQAIFLDPRWQNGAYYDSPNGAPEVGLGLAHMVSVVTYLSDDVLEQTFGRKPAAEQSVLERDMTARFDVQQYMHDQAAQLVKRFDANSLLYLTRAVDLYDLTRGYPDQEAALARITAQVLLISIDSDLLFPPGLSESLAAALRVQGVAVSHHVVESVYGHDAFLVEQHRLLPALRPFLVRITG